MVPVVRGLLNNLVEFRQFREQKAPTGIVWLHHLTTFSLHGCIHTVFFEKRGSSPGAGLEQPCE